MNMEGSCMRMAKLSPPRGETVASLLHSSFTATHPRWCERLVALALIAAGRPAKVVAPWLGRHRGTVEAWVRRFHAQGLEGLRPRFRGYPGTLLSAQELAQLQRTVQPPPRQAGLKTGTWTGQVGEGVRAAPLRADDLRRHGAALSATAGLSAQNGPASGTSKPIRRRQGPLRRPSSRWSSTGSRAA